MKQKKLKWPTQKNWVFPFWQFSIFFVKISWIGPWVSRIDWCQGHLCDSTYITMRLSDISSKTSKKCIFCVFMPFLSLWVFDSLILLTQGSIHEIFIKNIKNWWSWKPQFFWTFEACLEWNFCNFCNFCGFDLGLEAGSR